mmetsp:Transcript_39639/g.120067  ORF Transcript_39639/g.120067 Transcript_39639/m.120067 type:complete len:100 (+) Transcript_39639:834-1133(+)
MPASMSDATETVPRLVTAVSHCAAVLAGCRGARRLLRPDGSLRSIRNAPTSAQNAKGNLRPLKEHLEIEIVFDASRTAGMLAADSVTFRGRRGNVNPTR